ncbi:MAG: hypothetical protein JO153_17990 [Solirubrobacterales bacterium]|nr:hypothetical protein [Solirubrobacterales bacterium]
MFSPSLQSHSIQTDGAGIRREASPGRSHASPDRGRRRSRKEAVNDTPSRGHDGRSKYRFARHYAEMVAVMFIGMFVLMRPTGWLLSAFGTSWSHLHPAMNVFVMALTMTLPMVAWMHYRGHVWRPNAEMAASMLVPTFAVMGLLWAGIGSTGSLMVPEHVGMLLCMLVAMLLRRDEYSASHQSHALLTIGV